MEFGNIIFLHAIEMFCDLKIQHFGLDLHFMLGFTMVERYHNPPRLRKPHTFYPTSMCDNAIYRSAFNITIIHSDPTRPP